MKKPKAARSASLFLVSMILFSACSEGQKGSKAAPFSAEKMVEKGAGNAVSPLPKIEKAAPSDDYETAKKAVAARRRALAEAFEKGEIEIDSVGRAFSDCLVERIFPFWVGTEWSFEGHTDRPQKGSIACGYFVSTTLEQVGLRLNRFKIAQASPENEARMLALGGSVRLFRPRSGEGLEAFFSEKLSDDGLFFIGLGAGHVGFLLREKGRVAFIHSNYAPPAEVICQPLAGSVAVGFDHFFVADLSKNERLLRLWLEQKTVALEPENASVGPAEN